MLYHLTAESILLLHLAFIVFVVFGAAIAARWRWLPLIHIPAATWGFFVELTGRICPLTYAQNYFHIKAGQSGYSESFIEYYLLTIIYPDGLTREVQLVLAATVVLINVTIYG
jgi:hypothetical protein